MTRNRWIRWLVLCSTLLFVIVVRTRLLDFPLERDEGEYAYTGQLILQGVNPFSAVYTMKLPGTSLMYAAIMAVFGQSSWGIHLGFMIVNCATIIMLYFLSRKFTGETGALFSSAAYAVLSLSETVYGFAAHSEHFVVFVAIAGFLLLLAAVEKQGPFRYLFTGILLGAAGVMKQPGFLFLAGGLAYLIYHQYVAKLEKVGSKKIASRLIIFIAGALLPICAILAWMFVSNVVPKFWFWTVTYATEYANEVPWSIALTRFPESFFNVARGFFLLWWLAACGFVVTLFRRFPPGGKFFVIMFSATSLLAICPGFYFRNHYYVMLLPAVTMMAGIFVDFVGSLPIPGLNQSFSRLAAIVIASVSIILGVWQQKDYLFQRDPATLSDIIYGPNIFQESQTIAAFIASRSTNTDTIAVLGSEPQIYFYSGRRSATGYIYMYGLMEDNNKYSLTMQQELSREVESASPKFVVFVSLQYSWIREEDSEQYVFDWLQRYLNREYVLVGVADILPERTVYAWLDGANRYARQSSNYALIYERK